jgi:hypothetical protein
MAVVQWVPFEGGMMIGSEKISDRRFIASDIFSIEELRIQEDENIPPITKTKTT